MALNVICKNKVKPIIDILLKTNVRFIMMSRPKLEKVVQELEKNPYFNKYAEKIAKLQQTSPEEFLERVEAKEKELKQKRAYGDPRIEEFSKLPWKMTSPLLQSNKVVNQITRSFSDVVPGYRYITTPIFYVNSVPHIGHLYTALIADCISRFNLMQGHITLLTTGTDEHGTKVENAAKLMNISSECYCEQISLKFKEMCDKFDVGYTDFIRTTENRHKESVCHFWNNLSENGHIYKGKYAGWYCVPEEAFLSNDELVDTKLPNGDVIKVSSQSGHPVEWAEEDNYKFRLSSFRSDLKHWLKDENVVKPAHFHKILSDWIDNDFIMGDLSVSRPKTRVSWGIDVPGDPNQTIYVWFDALINYLTSLGYPDPKFKSFWPPDVQVIGKDILRFHGVYWPAFLIAAGLEPPRSLYCHSHWLIENEKMSKSKANVVSPFDASKDFTTVGLRYFLLRSSVPDHDANYSPIKIQNLLNSELADKLGNMITRCVGKSINPKKIIPNINQHFDILESEEANNLRSSLESLGPTVEKHYESFDIFHAVDEIMETVRRANVLIDVHKPWILKKDPHDKNAKLELYAVISLALETARISALTLYPVIPRLSTEILDYLNVPMTERSWKDTEPKYLKACKKATNERLTQNNIILFPKLKLEGKV